MCLRYIPKIFKKINDPFCVELGLLGRRREALLILPQGDEGVIAREDRELFWYAETAEEIWNGILAWYAADGAA
jgi:hypothetical protein